MLSSIKHLEVLRSILGTEIYNRKKDVGSATATWFADLLSPNPWWKHVVPDVGLKLLGFLAPGLTDSVSCSSRVRAQSRHRQCVYFHISLHQHCNILAVVSRTVFSSWRYIQKGDRTPRMQGSSAASFRASSRPGDQLHWFVICQIRGRRGQILDSGQRSDSCGSE